MREHELSLDADDKFEATNATQLRTSIVAGLVNIAAVLTIPSVLPLSALLDTASVGHLLYTSMNALEPAGDDGGRALEAPEGPARA